MRGTNFVNVSSQVRLHLRWLFWLGTSAQTAGSDRPACVANGIGSLCVLLALTIIASPVDRRAQAQTAGRYPYPAAARPNNNTAQPAQLGQWVTPLTQVGSAAANANQQATRATYRQPQENGASPMLVPYSGQSFASPSINQGYDPPPIVNAPVGSGLAAPSYNVPGFNQPAGDPSTYFNGSSPSLPGNPPPAFDPNASVVVPQAMPVPGALQQPVPLDIDVYVPQTNPSRLAIGGTYGSDGGLIGELIYDDRDFDIWRAPRSLDQLFSPQAFRGGGQTLRLEVVPGSDLERYVINFADPFVANSDVSLSLSGYYFDRQYFDWDEQRAGGRIALGRTLTNYLTVQAGLKLESVTVDNPRLMTSPQLNADLGNSNLFQFDIGFVYDTRQSPYLLDSGSYLAMSYKQAFGDYDFARADIDYRVQRLLFKRTPTSGHHTLSYRTKLGFSGSSTPVFENYLAGGFSSMRGFDYRGVSPIDGGVRVGGEFQWLNSLEYQFPITWDDMISGVAFVDFGTVEESIEIQSENFRVAPGVGLRINVPFAGMSAPLAVDFAFPVSDATGDDQRTISFLIGAIR